MQRPALNFYAKFTPRNFKGSGSARRARAIFETASPALQNFISVFKFSWRRFALNLRAVLHAIFAATRALPAKILSHIISLPRIVAQNFGKNLEINSAETKILRKNHTSKFSAPFATKNPVPRNFVLLNSMPLNLTLRNSARQNFTPQIFDPQSFARQSLGQQGYAQQSALARRNLTPKKSARRNRASKIAAPQNFMRLNLAVPQGLLPPNSAFKFKASADV